MDWVKWGFKNGLHIFVTQWQSSHLIYSLVTNPVFLFLSLLIDCRRNLALFGMILTSDWHTLHCFTALYRKQIWWFSSVDLRSAHDVKICRLVTGKLVGGIRLSVIIDSILPSFSWLADAMIWFLVPISDFLIGLENTEAVIDWDGLADIIEVRAELTRT